jgi:AraC family transcriptional regulator
MSKPIPSVTPKKDSQSTPTLSPCSVPYRWILHVGRCVNVYFDPLQPEAKWCEHHHPTVQILYFGPGSDCTIHWIENGAWTNRHVSIPSTWIIGAGIAHKLEWRRPALRLVFYLQPSFVAEFNGLEIKGSSLFSIDVVERCSPKISEFFRGFEVLEQPKTTAESLHVESLGSLAAVHLLQAWNCLTRPADSWETITFNEAVTKIDALIESRLSEKILLLDMARAVGMSESKLTRLFKRKLGVTPGHYLIDKRIRQSKTLLIEQDWTIGGIAVAVGFSNQGHFDFFFKRHTGMTPRDYRLLHKIDGI